jgi:riboflavin kinase/FMN adenylyltransferase
MRHVHSLDEAGLNQPSVVTIGVFDGVHRGHQHLIGQLISHGRETDRTPVVITFYPYPDTILRGVRTGYYLTLPDEKAALLGSLGVEVIVTIPFSEEVRQMRAGEFVRQMLEHLRMESLWVGTDFAMGYKREGNVAFLTEQSKQHDFELKAIDLMDANGEQVSSTRIRQALDGGDVAEAARLLGRPHRVTGSVVQGAGRGRTINIPTANLSFPEEQATPARGVYACWANVGEQKVASMVNIGMRPTFEGEAKQTVEAYLLDFDQDLYGQTISLDFIARLRNEQKFENVQALIDQIHRDVELGREILLKTS